MLDYQYLKAKLNTVRIGRSFIQFESLQSTAKKARVIASQSPDGMVVYAEKQWDNKTKRDRQWFSPQGGLYISIIVILDKKKDYCSLLTLLGGTAISLTLSEMGLSSVLKWPNDIMINDKKIGAVFVDSVTNDNVIKYILSINLNTSIDRELLDKNIDNPAISLREICEEDIVMEDLASSLLNRVEGLIEGCLVQKKYDIIYEPWERYIGQFNNNARLRKLGNKKWIECEIIGFNSNGELGFIQSNGNSDIIDPQKHEVVMIKE